MKKLLIGMVLGIIILSLGACVENQTQSEASIQESQTVSEVQTESSEPQTTMPPDFARGAEVEGTLYTQEGTGDIGSATLLVKEDGTFELKPIMYDGVPTITGTYSEESGGYTLTPLETDAFNIDVEEIGVIELSFDGDKLIYHGNKVGETFEGSVFSK